MGGGVRAAGASTFWLYAAIYGVLMFAAAAPTPLYGVYAARFHFSALTLTVVFAVYAVGLLAALLVAGRLSDHLGRRPVVLVSIAVQVVAMLCFALADSTPVLIAGRAVQGVATGAALGALSAGLLELGGTVAAGVAPMVTGAAPLFGLAAGALGTSALVQYAAAPLRLVYWLITAALVLGAVAVLRAPEPGSPRPGAVRSLVPVAAVPPHVRAAFGTVAPIMIAAWALNGFYLSLGPTLVARIEHSANHLWGGLAVFSFTFAAGVASLLARPLGVRPALVSGSAALTAGVLLSLIASTTSGVALFLAGSAVAGAGFGTGFLGGVRAISEAALPHERAGVLAVFYVLSYTAFSVPIVVAGIAQTHATPGAVAVVFCAAVAVLAVIGLLAALVRPRPAPVAVRSPRR
jgi:MFS family permease